jgi:pyruvate dehydrogenase phosphatase
MHDPGARRLHVALAGDSRAVLGRRRRSAWGTVSYDVHVLTQDHNGHNPAEVERLTPLHPGEALFANGRFVGWGPSRSDFFSLHSLAGSHFYFVRLRSFGNGKYKWDLETLTRLREGYLGGSIPPTIKTPPYFTAEPVVTTIDVQPGDFVVLASDGLWDVLTNAEVIGLVGLWLRRKHASYDRPVNRRALPATAMDEDTTQQYPWWRAAKRFVCVDDDNPATHLMRNALGGADKDLAEALLRLRGPLTRRFRCVLVVGFFDGGES